MFVQVVDEGIGTGWIAQGYQVLEEGNLQLALADQGIAVPAIVGLFVEEQDLQFPWVLARSSRAIARAMFEGPKPIPIRS